MEGLVECFITGVHLEFWGCLSAAVQALVILQGKSQLCPSPPPVQLQWHPSLIWKNHWLPDCPRFSRSCSEKRSTFSFVLWSIMFLEIPKILFNANFNLKRNKQNKIKTTKTLFNIKSTSKKRQWRVMLVLSCTEKMMLAARRMETKWDRGLPGSGQGMSRLGLQGLHRSCQLSKHP